MIEWFEESARLQALAAESLREPGAVGQAQRGRLIRAYQAKVVEHMTEAQRLRDSSQAVQP